MNQPQDPTDLPIQSKKGRIFLLNGHNKGFSLVEILVITGIITVVGLAVAGMMANFSKQQRRLNEQLARTEVLNFVNQVINNSQSCSSTLTSPIPFSFNASSLPASGGGLPSGALLWKPGQAALSVGDLASPLTPSLVINGLSLVNIINAGGADTWLGEIQVTFDPSKLVMALQPIKVRILINTDPASPINAKVVLGCGSSSDLSGQLKALLDSVVSHEVTACWDDNATHILDSFCPAGTALISCSGGPGDMDHTDEGFWLVSDYPNQKCTLTINQPRCNGGLPWTRQRVIASCYPI